MAEYGLRYQGSFTTYWNKQCDVSLYKANNTDGTDANLLKIRSLQIQTNNSNDGYGVIGIGAKLTIINNGTFFYYKDLMESNEAIFFIRVWLQDTGTIFEGYSVSDLNEQKFHDYSTLTIQFTDYLKRLDQVDYTIEDSSSVKRTYNIIRDSLDIADKSSAANSIYVNSTLFEILMTNTAGHCFLMYAFIKEGLFYESTGKTNSIYDALNKMLNSFGAFLYMFNGKIIIERYVDISYTHDWVTMVYDLSSDTFTPTSTTSLRQIWNRQAEDFRYMERSQTLKYTTGIQKLVINLQEAKVPSIVINNFSVSTYLTLELADDYTGWKDLFAFTLPNIWYLNTDCLTYVGVVNSTNGIEKGIEFEENADVIAHNGSVFYRVRVLKNTNPTIPTELNVEYSHFLPYWHSLDYNIIKQMLFQIWVLNDNNNTSAYPSQIIQTDTAFSLTYNPVLFGFLYASFSEGTGRMSKKVNLDPIFTLSGNTEYLDLLFSFSRARQDNGTFPALLRRNILGDFAITVESEVTDNEITSTINEDFIKTEEVDLSIYDYPDQNFLNGVQKSDIAFPTRYEVEATELWNSQDASSDESLIDLYIQSRYKKLHKTIKTITSDILCSKHLKLFAIFTDNNLVEADDVTLTKFILINYTWDVVNGTYYVELEEYPEVDIII